MKKEKNVKKLRENKAIKIIFLIMSVYFISTFFTQQISINKYNSQIKMYKADIANKEALTKYYDSQKNNISSDKYIEQIARDSLGLVKPYEKIFVDVNK